jgi:TM2 domain-containing membrane protein YozV
MLSALCPGAGQFYNGETAKALVLALVTLGLIVVLLWTPFGFPGSLGAVSPTAGVLMAAIGIVYVISLADAKAGAGRPRSRQSGWDV